MANNTPKKGRLDLQRLISLFWSWLFGLVLSLAILFGEKIRFNTEYRKRGVRHEKQVNKMVNNNEESMKKEFLSLLKELETDEEFSDTCVVMEILLSN